MIFPDAELLESGEVDKKNFFDDGWLIDSHKNGEGPPLADSLQEEFIIRANVFRQ